MNVELESEEYRMDWELYEGSIALFQMAIVWKEVSDQDSSNDLQITIKANGTKSKEVLRIRRIWQLANDNTNYDDSTELGETQMRNEFANMEYTNPAAIGSTEWFLGDIVPFERCAYIVNMNSDGTDCFYTFSRLMTYVKWDPILDYKLVVT